MPFLGSFRARLGKGLGGEGGWVFSVPRDEGTALTGARDCEFARRVGVLRGWRRGGLHPSRNRSAVSFLVVEWANRKITGGSEVGKRMLEGIGVD